MLRARAAAVLRANDAGRWTIPASRGPVWANLSWLGALGLDACGDAGAAATLRARLLRFAESAGFREYVDPDAGRGLGARGFSWTAALTLRELAER